MGILEGGAGAGRQAQLIHGEPVDVRFRLGRRHVVSATDDGEAVAQPQAAQVAFDVRMARVGRYAERQSGRAGVVEQGLHARQKRQTLVELFVDRSAFGFQLHAVGPLFERMPGVEGIVRVADAAQEEIPVERDGMAPVNGRVGIDQRRFGVDDEAVEVEDESAQHGGKVGPRGKAGKWKPPLPLGTRWAIVQIAGVRAYIRVFALAWAFAAPALAQDSGSFSQTLSSSDAAAAGLDKLSPEQRAKLDQLVEQYRSGALAAAEARAQAAERARMQAQADAAKAKADATKAQAEVAKVKSSGGFFSHAKAIIMPGTKIEYAAVEAHIAGRIRQWDRNTTILLDNGQRWKVADLSDYFNGPYLESPQVEIEPHLGGFRMHIDGMSYVMVKLVSGPTYKEDK